MICAFKTPLTFFLISFFASISSVMVYGQKDADEIPADDWNFETNVPERNEASAIENTTFTSLHVSSGLSVGDLVILQYNSDGGSDETALLALADMSSGDHFFISDGSWQTSASDWLLTHERGIKFTVGGSGITAGTIIRFDNPTGKQLILENTALGSLEYFQLGGSTEIDNAREFTLSTSGDQLVIFRTSDGVVTSTPIFIYAFNADISGTDTDGWSTLATPPNTASNLPSGLTALDGSQSNKTSAGAFGIAGLKGSEVDNYQYTGPTTAATKEDWISRIHTLSNWSSSDDTEFSNDDLASGGNVTVLSIIVDSDPPVFDTAPAVSSVTEVGFTVGASIDEGGDIYYVVVADGGTAPTPANVIAGQSNGGGTPLASGNGTGLVDPFTLSSIVTSLNAGTSYDVYVVARDDEDTPNVQAAVAKVDVTTSAPGTMQVAAKVFLEGAWDGSGAMNTILEDGNLIAANAPYDGINGHSGSESVASPAAVPDGAVDWVLVELREAGLATAALKTTRKGSKAGFLMSDGTIRATDGTSNLTVGLTGNTGNDYYVVIYHRNHLPIMSANSVAGSGGTLTIDFTSSSANTYQTTTALTTLSAGKFAMPAGDADGDGGVDATDLTTWRGQNGSSFIYNSTNGDLNLDGVINAVDRNGFQKKNSGKSSQVPNT